MTCDYDYKLVVPGDPKAQGRPRTRIIQTKVHVAELIRNIKVRIACIGQPNEPADWSEEIRQMDAVLAQSKKKAFASIYEDKKDREAKVKLAAAVKDQAPKELLEGPLRVDILFFFARPKGHYRTGKFAGMLKPQYCASNNYRISTPDRDNLDKLVLDALTGVFWRNDAIVCQGWLDKRYSERPRTEIYIKILDGEHPLIE